MYCFQLFSNITFCYFLRESFFILSTLFERKLASFNNVVMTLYTRNHYYIIHIHMTFQNRLLYIFMILIILLQSFAIIQVHCFLLALVNIKFLQLTRYTICIFFKKFSIVDLLTKCQTFFANLVAKGMLFSVL